MQTELELMVPSRYDDLDPNNPLRLTWKQDGWTWKAGPHTGEWSARGTPTGGEPSFCDLFMQDGYATTEDLEGRLDDVWQMLQACPNGEQAQVMLTALGARVRSERDC